MSASSDTATGPKRRERHLRARRVRWRPVCPECGYSLRRLTSDRCPECGDSFPTPSRVYRRWAWRRLPWERRHRAGLVFAYLKTIVLVAFRPGRAARGLAIPDRWGRAVRWGAVHLLLFAAAGLFLGSDKYFAQRAFSPLERWTDSEPVRSGEPDPPIVLWAAQSLCAWLVTGATLPLLGVALGAAVPGRHPAAKRGIAKWSLYSSALISLPVVALSAVSSALEGIWALDLSGISWAVNWGQAVPDVLNNIEPPPPLLGAVLYAIWWARGVSVNSYLRRRGFAVFAANAVAYVASWIALAWLLFDPKALARLL